MRTFFAEHGKAIALLFGFLFSTVGALWALLVTDNLSSQIQQLADTRSANSTAIDRLNRLQSEYFIANQQGDLIFVLSAQAAANDDLVADLLKGNMLDRAAPVRNMLGELALERQLVYDSEMGAYNQLNDQVRANLTAAGFRAVKAKEQEIISKGQARVPELMKQNAEIDRTLNAKQAQQSRNHILGVTMAIIGSVVLLAANLVTERAGEHNAAKSTAEIAAEQPEVPASGLPSEQ